MNQSYQLVGNMVIPPGAASEKKPVVLAAAVKQQDCPPASGGVGLMYRKGKLLLTIDQEALMKQPDGWLGARMRELETSGCLDAGSAEVMASAVLQAVPMPVNAGLRLLRPRINGQTALEPPMQIRLNTPILQEGTPENAPILQDAVTTGSGNSVTVTAAFTPSVIGVETSFFGLEKQSGSAGYSITPLRAERRVGGEVQQRDLPSVNPFRALAGAAYYRLIFKAGDSDFTALVIGAKSQDEFGAQVASCADWKNGFCVGLPKHYGVNPVVPVMVNGKQTTIFSGDNIAALLAKKVNGSRSTSCLG